MPSHWLWLYQKTADNLRQDVSKYQPNNPKVDQWGYGSSHHACDDSSLSDCASICKKLFRFFLRFRRLYLRFKRLYAVFRVL